MLGIGSFFTSVFGIITAILAIVFGVTARGRIRESGDRLEGRGMATAGMVLGITYLVLAIGVIVAAVVFVLVSDLGGGEEMLGQDSVIVPGDQQRLQGFFLMEPGTIRYEIQGNASVTAGIIAVDDADDPDRVGDQEWGSRIGEDITATVDLAAGDYGLYMYCTEPVACQIDYVIYFEG